LSDITVLRYVNIFYYFVFLVYIVLFFLYLYPRRKKEPFINTYKIFWATSLVLIAMEVFGTLTGMRVFYIGGERNVGIQLALQMIMGFGEGGTSTGIMYLMVISAYNKNYKRFLYWTLVFSIVIITFASGTYLYAIL